MKTLIRETVTPLYSPTFEYSNYGYGDTAVIQYSKDHIAVGSFEEDEPWTGVIFDVEAAEHLRDQITAWLERREVPSAARPE